MFFNGSAKPIWKVYFEFIQVVYYDTASPWQWLLILALAVTWRAADPRHRVPFDFQLWLSRSGDAKQKCLSILVAPLIFDEARGGAVPIYTRARFHAHNLFYWSHTDSWSVNNKIVLPHHPQFLGCFILMCVYKYRYWLCDIFNQKVPSSTKLRTPYVYCSFFSFRSEYMLLQISYRIGFSARLRFCNHLSKSPFALILDTFFFCQSQDFLASFPGCISPIFRDITLVHFSPLNSNVSFFPKSHLNAASTTYKTKFVSVKIHILWSKLTIVFNNHHWVVTRRLCMIQTVGSACSTWFRQWVQPCLGVGTYIIVKPVERTCVCIHSYCHNFPISTPAHPRSKHLGARQAEGL